MLNQNISCFSRKLPLSKVVGYMYQVSSLLQDTNMSAAILILFSVQRDRVHLFNEISVNSCAFRLMIHPYS